MRPRNSRSVFGPDARNADAELRGVHGEALDRILFAFGIGFPASGSQDETGPIQAPLAAPSSRPDLDLRASGGARRGAVLVWGSGGKTTQKSWKRCRTRVRMSASPKSFVLVLRRLGIRRLVLVKAHIKQQHSK